MTLQSQIAAHIVTPGGVKFLKYRGFKNAIREADEPFRFVDGELLEKFLDCDADTQESIVKGLGEQWNVERVRESVEELRRLT
jgi:DNA damage-binding protein 1